jgi:hypothetical protein
MRLIHFTVAGSEYAAAEMFAPDLPEVVSGCPFV